MQTYLLIIEYDGTNFSGWQIQPGRRTIQEELEKALHKIFRYRIKSTAAGRTDAGVHAVLQAVSIQLAAKIKPPVLRLSLNALLPKDIAVIRIKAVSREFNARFDAYSKVYEYRIWNNTYRTVWNRFSWHIPQILNIEAMRQGASCLKGKHNYKAFEADGSSQDYKIVWLEDVKIYRRDGLIVIRLKADRFLYKMVRNIVGTLVDVGLGRIGPKEIQVILNSKERGERVRLAPPRGLFLREIVF